MPDLNAITITAIAAIAILTAPSYTAPRTMASNTAAETSTSGISGRDSPRQNSSAFRGRLRFKAYNPQNANFRSSDIIGLEVFNLGDQRIGLIDDIIIGSDQVVKGIVINVGGFLGVGNRDVAVTANSILLLKRGAKLDRALIDVTEETLKSMDRFDFSTSKRDQPPVSATP